MKIQKLPRLNILIEERLPWSLRRHVYFKKCQRFFFLHYLMPAATPLTSDTESFQAQLHELRQSLHLPLFWTSAILKATDDAFQNAPNLDIELLASITAQTLKYYTQLTRVQQAFIIKQLREAGWFEQMVVRHSASFKPIAPGSDSTIFFNDYPILMLPPPAFQSDTITMMFLPSIGDGEFTRFHDALCMLFLRDKRPWFKHELRLRKLIFNPETNTQPIWTEKIVRENDISILSSFLTESIEMLRLNETHELMFDTDFPPTVSPEEACPKCPYFNVFCQTL